MFDKNKSVLDVEDRHHSIRYSISNEEEINIIYEKIKKLKNLRYGLIGAIEESEVKGKHIHICMSYNNVKNGKAVLKDLGIKDKYHIRPIYRLKYNDKQECIFDDGRKSFYGYAKKNGMLYEHGEPCKDKKKDNKDDKKNDKSNIDQKEIENKLKIMLEKYGGKMIELSEEEKEEKLLISQSETSLRRQYVISRLKTFGGIHLFHEWITKMGLDGMKDLNHLIKRHYKCDSTKIKPRGGNPFTDKLNIQILGASGQCKSETVKNWCEMMGLSCYERVATSEYWDGYTDQEVVVVNEINRIEFGKGGGGDAIKRMCDRHGFSVNKKHEVQDVIRPKYIIFTSNRDLIEVGEEYYDHEKVKKVNDNWVIPMRNRLNVMTLEGFCREMGIKTNITRNKKDEIIYSETIWYDWPTDEHIDKRCIAEIRNETIDRISNEMEELYDRNQELEKCNQILWDIINKHET